MSAHIVPTRVYHLIFAALMVGTYLTVQAAFIDLGAFNTVVALADDPTTLSTPASLNAP